MRVSTALALWAAVQAGRVTLDLGIGINMGNVLEAPVEGAWAPVAQEYYFDDYVSAGFKSVRIPVRWDNHTMTVAPYTIDSKFLARVGQVVQWSLSRNLTTIINSHHDDWLDDQTAFPTMLPRFQAIWTQVAAYFASAPSALVFECYNEPHVMSVAQLNTMFATFYTTVRANNPTRWLLFGGLQWDSPSWVLANPNAMVIPGLGRDAAIALEVHDYDPFHFTTPPISINTWGTPADIAALDQEYANLARWSAAYSNIPILLGEFGCSVQQTNTTARLLWYRSFAAAVKVQSALAGYMIWDDDGWFETYNRAARTWDQPVLTAIGL